MARSAPRIKHPFYQAPTPPEGVVREPPILGRRDPNRERDGPQEWWLGDWVRVVAIDENVILVSKEYEDDLDPDDRDPWWEYASSIAKCLWKTCVAYSLIGEGHPMILPFVSRDVFSGFPILAKPTGPQPCIFMKDHETRMYPVESSDSFVTISPSYLPLVLHWALNTLSALKFLHSRNIAYGDIDLDETCWLSADLSLLLIGFIDSMFVEPEYNELHRSRDWDLVNVDTDLFAWAALLCILLTKKPGVQNGYSSRLIGAPNARQNIVPDVSGHTDFDTIVGDIVRKCFALEYDTADEVWAGFEVVLQSQGYEVEGYGLKGFDPTSILLSATDNLAL